MYNQELGHVLEVASWPPARTASIPEHGLRNPAVRPIGLASEVHSNPPARGAVPRLRVGVAEVIHNLAVQPTHTVSAPPTGVCSPPTLTTRLLGAKESSHSCAVSIAATHSDESRPFVSDSPRDTSLTPVFTLRRHCSRSGAYRIEGGLEVFSETAQGTGHLGRGAAFR
jgi:hypothetical protein